MLEILKKVPIILILFRTPCTFALKSRYKETYQARVTKNTKDEHEPEPHLIFYSNLYDLKVKYQAEQECCFWSKTQNTKVY